MKTDPDGCSRRTEVHYASAPRVFAADSVDDDVELSLELSAGRSGRSALCRIKSLFAEVKDQTSGTPARRATTALARPSIPAPITPTRCGCGSACWASAKAWTADATGSASAATWNGMLPAE